MARTNNSSNAEVTGCGIPTKDSIDSPAITCCVPPSAEISITYPLNIEKMAQNLPNAGIVYSDTIPPPGTIDVNSAKAKAAAIIGINAIAIVRKDAYPAFPAMFPKDTIAVPDITNPTTTPNVDQNPNTRFNFFPLFN